MRGTGDSELASLREWFDALWEDYEDISQRLAVEMERRCAIAQIPPLPRVLEGRSTSCTTPMYTHQNWCLIARRSWRIFG